MSVDVAAGLALIEVTTTLLSPNATFKTWFYSDDVVNVPVPTADLTNPRKDRIVATFDMGVDPNTAASNILSIDLIEGTPAGSPTAPATPSNAISLAIIDVPASDTAITDDQITDDRAFVTLGTDVLADVVRSAVLASTDNGEGASLVGVEDADGNFTATTVEGVLAELQDNIDAAALPAAGDAGEVLTSTGAGWESAPPGATPLGAILSDLNSGNVNSGNPTASMGDFDIPANSVAAGDTIHVRMTGAVSESGGGDANSTFTLRMGTTDIASLGGAITPGTIYLDVIITIQSLGVSGAFSVSGLQNSFSSSTLTIVNGNGTVDTTANMDLSFLLSYVSGSANSIMRIDHFSAYKIKAAS